AGQGHLRCPRTVLVAVTAGLELGRLGRLAHRPSDRDCVAVSLARRSPPEGGGPSTPPMLGAPRYRESAETRPRRPCARLRAPAARSASPHSRTAVPISAPPAARSSSNCRPC